MNIANFLRTSFLQNNAGGCFCTLPLSNNAEKVEVRYKYFCNNWDWYKQNFTSKKKVYINQLQHSRKTVLL